MLTPLTLQGHLGSAEAPRLRSRATTAMAQFSIAAKWKELADEAGWPEERSTPALHGVSVFASEVPCNVRLCSFVILVLQVLLFRVRCGTATRWWDRNYSCL